MYKYSVPIFGRCTVIQVLVVVVWCYKIAVGSVVFNFMRLKEVETKYIVGGRRRTSSR